MSVRSSPTRPDDGRWANAAGRTCSAGTHWIVWSAISTRSTVDCWRRGFQAPQMPAIQSPAMSVRRPLALICFIAALHGLLLIWYQQPDWATQWPDQDGYKRLGQVLATTGKFTRFPDAPQFVPEVLRTPAYPIFVAAVY